MSFSFKPLEPSAQKTVDRVLKNYPVCSDINFCGALTWDITDAIKFDVLSESSIVFKLADYHSRDEFLTFIARDNCDELAHRLLEYARSHDLIEELRLVPEFVAEKCPSLEKTEDRDNFDYILSADELSRMPASIFRGKRNLINRFAKNYPEYKVVELDLASNIDTEQMIKVFEAWQHSRQRFDDEAKDELIAIQRAHNLGHGIGLKCLGLSINGQLVAFTIYEIYFDKEAVIHFDKADTRHAGAFETLKMELAKELVSRGIKTINYEQDLGIDGLRRAKESYHPVDFIKKYTLKM